MLSARSLILFVLVLSTAGCGRIAFVSDRYDNFTAYYNTFYNAERSFREGVEVINQSTESINREQYLSVFPAPGQTSNDQRFQAAIDKSADVLRDHPNSKWVDDALVLIGKSYFYQRNFVSAEQKFREAIDLGTVLEDEARLWLARTLIASGSYDNARDHLQESLLLDDLSDRWEPSLRLALGELFVKRGALPEAADELLAGLEDIRDSQIEARGWFLLGQVYETLGRYADAVDAFNQVSRTHPRYELAYAAQLSAVRVDGMYGDGDSALRELRRMERDDKNYVNRFELAYVRALIYQSQGYAGDARALYNDILYNSDGQIANVRGRIHYALGELYRDAYGDFQMAAAHFDTARTAIQSPTVSASGGVQGEVQPAPEAITDASEQASMFGSFATVSGRLAEMDSLLHLGELSEEDFSARILEIRTRMAEELAEEERRIERLQAQQGFQNTTDSGMNRSGGSQAQSDPSGSSGFLFHTDPVRVQEGRVNFIMRWGDRPHAPNWRRLAAIEGVASVENAAGDLSGERLQDLDPSVGGSPLPPLDYADVPRDSLSRAAMRAQRAAARYELANVLFLSINLPDSAASLYRAVIEEDSEYPVAQRAYYALAEVHRSLGDSVSANRLYEQVLRDYPESDFAGRVREQLGIRVDAPSDTIAVAEENYERAFQQWRGGAYGDALNDMVELAAAYRGLDVAPRALLAAGRIFLEWAHRDTLDVYGPLPLTVPDSVLGYAGLLDVNVASSPDTSETEIEDVPDADEAERTGPLLGENPLDASETDQPLTADERPRPEGEGQAAQDGLTETPDSTGADDAGSVPSTIADASQVNAADRSATADDSLSGEDMRSAVRNAEEIADTSGSVVHPSDADPSPEVATLDSSGVDVERIDSLSTSPQFLATAAEEDEIYLKTLYAGVRQNYPSSAYADVADQLLRALDERQVELRAAADSVAAAAAESELDSSGVWMDSLHVDTLLTASDSSVAAISTMSDGYSAERDTLAMGGDPLAEDSLAPGDQRLPVDSTIEADSLTFADSELSRRPATAAAFPSTGEEAIRGDGGISEELGGFTLVLGVDTSKERIMTLADKYAREGFRTDVIVGTVNGETVYRAALGQFATRRDAEVMLQKYQTQIDEQVQPASLDDLN